MAIVDDGHLGGRLLQARRQSLRKCPAWRACEHHLIDLDFDHLRCERRVARPRREYLLGHRAGGIPGSCAHLSLEPVPQVNAVDHLLG